MFTTGQKQAYAALIFHQLLRISRVLYTIEPVPSGNLLIEKELLPLRKVINAYFTICAIKQALQSITS